MKNNEQSDQSLLVFFLICVFMPGIGIYLGIQYSEITNIKNISDTIICDLADARAYTLDSTPGTSKLIRTEKFDTHCSKLNTAKEDAAYIIYEYNRKNSTSR